ncbi:MAG: hypothetical protein HUJ76_13065, partial [Parasporobacterium sp.]|nr:hypothetical protein [Parasporobacterium sp.]
MNTSMSEDEKKQKRIEYTKRYNEIRKQYEDMVKTSGTKKYGQDAQADYQQKSELSQKIKDLRDEIGADKYQIGEQYFKDMLDDLYNMRTGYKASADASYQMSKYDTELDFNKAATEYGNESTSLMDAQSVATRQDIYKQNQNRIDELSRQIATERLKNLAGSNPFTYGAKLITNTEGGTIDALEREKSNLQQEQNRYNRLQKVKDDTVTYQNASDFNQYAYQRNRVNPTAYELNQTDLSKYRQDTSIDWSNYDYDENTGRYVNRFTGDVIDPIQSEIPDKLVLYLSATDNIKQQARDRLTYSTGNGNTYDYLLASGDANNWNLLTQGEIDTYYYLYNKQGKTAAEKYLDDMSSVLGKRSTDAMTEGIKDADNGSLALKN